MTDSADARSEKATVLQNSISQQSDVTAEPGPTGMVRAIIHMTFMSVLGTSGFMVVWQLMKTPMLTEWLDAVRFSVSTVGVFFMAVFYIRWNDYWLRRIADREQKLQQTALDVDRAKFVAKMLRESRENKEGEMPAVLLDRLTTGLFLDPTTTSMIRHPAEDVTRTLLRASSRVRVDIPGIGEVTFTGRDSRRAAKKRAKSADKGEA